MDVIQQTLLNYAKAKGYLPCPADITLTPSTNSSYGVEHRFRKFGPPACVAANFTSSNTVGGMLPTKTLRLDDSFALDGFGRPFIYAVDNRLSVGNAGIRLSAGQQRRLDDSQ